jgi:RNA polymerase sigma factor (sigma-70 family)
MIEPAAFESDPTKVVLLWDCGPKVFATAYPQWEAIDQPHGWLWVAAQRAYWRHVYQAERHKELTDAVPLYRDVIDQSEAERAIFEALAALPERQRQVMAWKLDGYQTAEIAAHLDMTPEAVRKTVERARKALRRHLGMEEGGK